MRRLYVCLLTFAVCLPLPAQKKLTLESVYHPTERVAFSGNSQFGSEWLNDREILWPKREGTTTTLQLFDVRTGKARPFIDTAKLAAALEAAGLAAPASKSATARPFFTWDANKRTLIVNAAEDLWHYDLAANRAVRLTSGVGEEELASFSPDARSVAFVRNFDLHVVDVATQRERALTTGGGPKLLNGKLDWIYQEELYGRGNFKGYWWSPDSTRIAFLQLDESGVPEYTIVDDIDYRPDVDTYPYPKAGDPNPKAALFIVSAAGGAPVKVDMARYADVEPLLVDVTWSPANDVVYQVQNREQTWLDLNRANPATGESRTLLRETTKAWVDVNGSPRFLADGSFLWLSERTGWKHIYHHAANGSEIRPVTSGHWEARVLHGVDEKTRTVFFSGTERTSLGLDVYSISLDGTNLKRLSSEPGTHAATFSPGFTHYIDIRSTLATPSQSRVHRRDGSVAQVLDANPVRALAEYGFRAPEIVQVKNRDGVVMDATLLKPANFDPSKKYPVFQHTYAGPHIQQVRNAWMGTFGMFHQYLASDGYIVWVLENTTSSGKGGVSAWPAYRSFGESELRDIEDGIAWLKSQPWVDGSRIAIEGWSNGGWMAAYAATHSKSFAAAIAGAPVTDWLSYDSILIERFMGHPKNNPEGYRKSSPRWNAKDLNARLLLLHGTIDDNVHLQNTFQFAQELQKEGKLFEMMLYPRTRHTVFNPMTNLHVAKTTVDFLRRALGE